MSRKVKVQICVGTACHIMGAADLVNIEDLIAAPRRNQVEIVGVSCMGLCKDEANGKPPFVTVDGQTMAQATLDRVLGAIDRRLEKVFDEDPHNAGS